MHGKALFPEHFSPGYVHVSATWMNFLTTKIKNSINLGATHKAHVLRCQIA